MITYDDFKKLDIRIGTILSAERVPEADKLLKLEVDLGAEKRQIMAGIAKEVADEKSLIGKQIPILANLETKVLRGYESQGMILAADDNGKVVLIHPDKDITAGSIIR